MRHALSQMAAVALVAVTGGMAHAQTQTHTLTQGQAQPQAQARSQGLVAQLTRPMVAYRLGADGAMIRVGELPIGSVVQMKYDKVVLNAQSNRPDLQQTVDAWKNLNPSSNSYVPMQLTHMNGQKYDKSETVYLSYESVKAANGLYALGDRHDYRKRANVRVAQTIAASPTQTTNVQAPASAIASAAPVAQSVLPKTRVVREQVPTGVVRETLPATGVQQTLPAAGMQAPPQSIAQQTAPAPAQVRPSAIQASEIAPTRIDARSLRFANLEQQEPAREVRQAAPAQTLRAQTQTARTESNECVGCHNQQNLSQTAATSNQMAEVARAALGPNSSGGATVDYPASKNPHISREIRNVSAKCNKFMTDDGALGAWGEAAGRMLLRPEFKTDFFKSNAMGTFCPRFNQLDNQQQLQAWIWLIRSLAQEEAGCEPSTTHSTHVTVRGRRVKINHFTGYGMLTVEKDLNIRRRHGRLPQCSDINTAEGQIYCGLSMIQKHQVGKTGGNLNSRGNFGPLSSKRNWARIKMIPHMKRFTECGVR